MENRKRRVILFALIVSFVINIGLAVFVAILATTPNSPLEGGTTQRSTQYIITDVDNSLLNEVMGYIERNYFYSGNISATAISRGAAKGIVQSLGDKYSVFLDPATSKQESTEYSGSYMGIGAYIGVNKNNQIVIISPMDDSPAKEAGLKSGDAILKINDATTSELSVTEASMIIQGEAGSEVTLLISREGIDAPFEVKLTRRAITIESVYYEVNSGVAYIRISQFLQNTGSELHEDLVEINKQKVSGIILDLRDDPGGLLDQAIDVASEFLEGGIVVKSLDNQGQYTNYRVVSGGLATKIPLVVLVNQGSASASEIVAGAIQDYGRAKLVGQKTFGKGSVQVIIDLSDGSSLHLTTAQWLTPNSRHITGEGLQPDLLSELEDQDLVKYATDIFSGKN